MGTKYFKYKKKHLTFWIKFWKFLSYLQWLLKFQKNFESYFFVATSFPFTNFLSIKNCLFDKIIAAKKNELVLS